MTRDRLDRLREKTRAFRDAVRRDEMMAEAGRRARAERARLAAELADELYEAELPEGRGLEAAGLVVWWEGDRGRDRLHHVFLACYRGTP